MKRLLAALVFTHLSVPTMAQQVGYYSVNTIAPLPGTDRLSISGINASGEIVGVSLGSPVTNQRPFIYRPGSGTQPLPFPPGTAFSVPMDINDLGEICGFAQPTWSAEQCMTPWVWRNDQITTRPGAGASLAVALNNHGQLVGRACLSGTNLTCYTLGSVEGDVSAGIGAASFYSSSQWRPVEINDAGQTLLTPPQPAPGQRREPDGTITPLPAAPAPYTRTYTWAINNTGVCLARYEYNIGSQYFSRVFTWSPQDGVRYAGPSGSYTYNFARGLNNAGQVLGESGNNQNSVLSRWLWTPGSGAVEVSSLIDPAEDLTILGVSVLNDRGQIVARAVRTSAPIADLTIVLTPPASACRADLSSLGGSPMPDGQLTVDDLIAYLSGFFNGDVGRADFASLGGGSVPDGQITADDLIAFLAAFFAGC